MAANFRLRDWAHVRIGDRVQVRMGAGWAKGTLTGKAAHAATINLGNRSISCFDPRNLKKC